MYSEEIERMEFPIPNKVLAFRRKHISSQLKVDEELKDVSLHHVIRSERCPLATKLQEFDKEFKECIDNRKDASRKSLVEYRKVIDVSGLVFLSSCPQNPPKSSYCIKQIDYIFPCVCTVVDRRIRHKELIKNSRLVSYFLFFTLCDVICDLLQYTRTGKCNLFVK